MEVFDYQFSLVGTETRKMPVQKQTVSVVVAKPTRLCNADCEYCSSPPLEELGYGEEPGWTFETFKSYFDQVYPTMVHGAFWIWHGGEPMLMGPNFYMKCYEYAKSQEEIHGRKVLFSMQTNLLAYNKEKWYKVFSEVLGGSISSSFDPDEKQRTMKGNPETYSRIFKRAIENVLKDGFRPMVIGVFSEQNAHLMKQMYDWSKSFGENAFPVRFNYCHPTGRLESGGEVIAPSTYAQSLINVYDYWIQDNPTSTITPLDQMFKRAVGLDGIGHCPWLKSCGGRFLEIEPNGEVYNCSEFADLGKKYCYGNLNDKKMTVTQMLNSQPARLIKRRSFQTPVSCQTCEHYKECEGGCMRDSLLFKNGLYGKFHYCTSWKKVLTRIKESILTGEAKPLLDKYGVSLENAQSYVTNELREYFGVSLEQIEDVKKNGAKSPFGFGNNFNVSLFLNNEDLYNEKGEYLPKHKPEAKYDDPEKNHLSGANARLNAIKLVIEN